MALDLNENPPPSPDVQQQQAGNPLAQFSEGAMNNMAGTLQAAKANAMDLVMTKLTSVASDLTTIAGILQVERPQLMPVLTRAAGVMKVLETELQKTQGQGKPPQPGLAQAQM